MDDLRRYFVPAPHGEVSLVFDRLARAEVLAIIHGAAPAIAAAQAVGGAGQLWAAQPITLVGESLGGVIALHMEAERRILLDPPMEPTPAVAHEIRYGNVAPWLQPLITSDYWSLLDSQDQRVEAVCASNGILPQAARDRLSAHPNVDYGEIAGGHVLLDDNPQAVLQLIQKRSPGRD